MVPWSITRATGLPPNANLREMQQNAHRMVQLMRAATPDDESISPTQGATRIVWCGNGVGQSRGRESNMSWVGNGPKTMPGELTLPLSVAARSRVSAVCLREVRRTAPGASRCPAHPSSAGPSQVQEGPHFAGEEDVH